MTGGKALVPGASQGLGEAIVSVIRGGGSAGAVNHAIKQRLGAVSVSQREQKPC
jgi:hypothetical protein